MGHFGKKYKYQTYGADFNFEGRLMEHTNSHEQRPLRTKLRPSFTVLSLV